MLKRISNINLCRYSNYAKSMKVIVVVVVIVINVILVSSTYFELNSKDFDVDF